MNACNFSRVLLVAGLLFHAPQLATAQFSTSFGPGGGVISGMGTSIIKETPDFMRMRVQMTASGKTLKEALAKLAENRAAALKHLTELGAVKESIKFEGPKPAALSDQQQQMMQMVMRQRNRGAKRPTEKGKTSTVMLSLTADWPLAGKTTEALLLEVDALQAKIKAANVAQVGETELTPEEQELAEEMEEMSNNYGQEEMEKPGTPNFIFGKKLDSSLLATATKEAFAKAQESAVRLSKAAGAELGPLRQLNSQAQVSNLEDPYGRMSGMYRYYAMQQGSGDEDELTEAIGMDVSEVQVTVRVHAAFALKE